MRTTSREVVRGLDFLAPLYEMADALDRHAAEIVENFLNEHRPTADQHLALYVLSLDLFVAHYCSTGERSGGIRGIGDTYDFLQPLYDLADASDADPSVEIVGRFLNDRPISMEEGLGVIVLGLNLLVFWHRALGLRLNDVLNDLGYGGKKP